MINLANQSAANERGCTVADCSHDGSPELTRREPRRAGRCVISCRAHAARIGKDLSYGDKRAECDCESKAHNSVKSHAECKAAYGAEQSFPGQWIVVPAASASVSLNRYGAARRSAGCPSEEKYSANTVNH